MLERALTYCLQEETHVSFADLMDINKNENKQPKVQAQTIKFDVQPIKQSFIQKSSLKELIQQPSQEFKQKMKIVQDFSPYESEWQKSILSKYYKQNLGNNSFCNKTRRRAFSIQMNSKKVNLRIRDMSMFTDRKQSKDPKIQF